MKTYSLEDIKQLTQNKQNYISEDEQQEEKGYSIEEIDKAKTRMLKYIIYKKRTESEIRKKFSKDYSDEIIDDVINNLKENGYIDDLSYIERAVNEFIALKHLSIKEIKYKLLSKGIATNDLENYIENNYEQLIDYEKNSANHLVQKKASQMEKSDIKLYLLKKGYSRESINDALDNL